MSQISPTYQDIVRARRREEESAEALSRAFGSYVALPSDEREALLQKQISDYRQRWMYLRVRPPETPT